MNRFAPLPRLALATMLVSAAGCSGKVAPAAGLLLVMCTDGTLYPDSLSVRVRATDGSKTYRDRSYDINAQTFPATLALAASGGFAPPVTIDVGVARAGILLDNRHYEVTQIPTDRVAELDVFFSDSCATASCEPGTTCGRNGRCALDDVRASVLPTYASEAAVAAKCAAAQVDAASPGSDGGAGDVSLADSDSDGSSPATDASEPMGSDGPDGDDAVSPDAGGTDGARDVTSDALGDADQPCSFGAERCVGNAPQGCNELGRWQNAPLCVPGVTHCSGVRCVPVPPSCKDAPPGAGSDCSSGGTADCCASYEVASGTFFRDYDGAYFTDKRHPARITSFRLDAFEITVGRFRQFVNATLGGWRPQAGSGKHGHLRNGQGLVAGGDAGLTYETGWDVAWNTSLPVTKAEWDDHLFCPVEDTATWTPNPGIANEKLPITCVSWFDAYAFCIWDGGFLPSTAEWNFAAAGGEEQRIYAWGNDAPGGDTARAIWGCHYGGGFCEGLVNVAPVGSARGGDGRWSQSDLTGSVWEWNLDNEGPLLDPCEDCASTASALGRTFRGGAFENKTTDLAVSYHEWSRNRHPDVGARCARAVR